jgi:ribosomal protein S8
MKLYVKIALFAVMFIAVAAILAALYLFSMKHSDIKKAKPDFEISATQLQKEFEYDETKASIKYINKVLEVNGTIASVEQKDNNSVNISLSTENHISSVICNCPAISDPSVFKPGDQITIRGICSGFLMDVLLNNCAVIKNKNQ